MRNFIVLFLVALGSHGSLQAQTLVSARQIDFSSSLALNFLAGGLAKYDITTYKVTYRTLDVGGNPALASGAISIPLGVTCDSLGIVSYNHGTVTEDANVPSRNNTESLLGKVAASTGFVVTMPDYLGLGDHAGVHPYLHSQSQATATLDLIKAAREYIADSTNLTLSSEVFLTGYSQGGHAAMATAKYAQDNNLLSQFNITAVLPASGPYQIKKNQSQVVIWDATLATPAFVAYYLEGHKEAFSLYQNAAAFYKSPYDTLIPYFLNGSFPLDSLNNALPNRISMILQDSVRQNFIRDSVRQRHPIWRALTASDNHDWKPQFPVGLYYCSADRTVQPQNSLATETAMRIRGATVFSQNSGPFDHGGCVLPAMLGILDYVDTNSTSCDRALGLPGHNLPRLSLYPNPATNKLFIAGLPVSARRGKARIYNLQGQLLWEVAVANEFISVGHLPKGPYLLSYTAEGLQWHGRFYKR